MREHDNQAADQGPARTPIPPWWRRAIVFLLLQVPLHDHHFVLLAAALGAAAGASLASARGRLEPVALTIAAITAAAGIVQDYRQIHRSVQPEPSEIRPHRGSRAISTIGAKVHLSPAAEASAAATRAARSTVAGSQLLVSPRGIGKIVR